MISLKRFLNAPEEDGGRIRVIATLLEAIAAHSPAGDATEHRRYQADIRSMASELAPGTEPAQLLLIAGRAVQALEEHNRRTTALMNQQSAELRTIVEMLTNTVSAIGTASGRSTARLGVIQQELKTSSEIGDVRLLKGKIFDCLKGIEAEVESQNQESGVTLDTLRQQLKSSQAVLGGTGVSSVKGLRGRAEAEQALTEACRSAVQTFAVVYVLDRLVTINNRFGLAIGDSALRKFEDFIMRDARPEDVYFRWNGQTFLALMQRPEPIEVLRRAVARTISQKCEMTVDTDQRQLMLPLSTHWGVFPMFAAPRLMIGKVEGFASEQARANA